MRPLPLAAGEENGSRLQSGSAIGLRRNRRSRAVRRVTGGRLPVARARHEERRLAPIGRLPERGSRSIPRHGAAEGGRKQSDIGACFGWQGTASCEVLVVARRPRIVGSEHGRNGAVAIKHLAQISSARDDVVARMCARRRGGNPHKLVTILWGERPHTRRSTVRWDKQRDEETHVPMGDHE